MRAKSTFKCKLWMYTVTTVLCFLKGQGLKINVIVTIFKLKDWQIWSSTKQLSCSCYIHYGKYYVPNTVFSKMLGFMILTNIESYLCHFPWKFQFQNFPKLVLWNRQFRFGVLYQFTLPPKGYWTVKTPYIYTKFRFHKSI